MFVIIGDHPFGMVDYIISQREFEEKKYQIKYVALIDLRIIWKNLMT
jgi:hypothetical protein